MQSRVQSRLILGSTQMAIKSHQEPSRAIKSPREPSSAIKRHQWQSRAIKGHDLHVAQMFVEDGARRLARGARHLHRRIELIPQRRVLARLRRGAPGRGGSE